MADAPRLLTPSEVDAHLWTLQRGGHLTQGTYIAALHTLRAAWGEIMDLKVDNAKLEVQRGDWKTEAQVREHELDAARAALRLVEWRGALLLLRGDDASDTSCPACGEYQHQGHAATCVLKAALGEPAGQEDSLE